MDDEAQGLAQCMHHNSHGHSVPQLSRRWASPRDCLSFLFEQPRSSMASAGDSGYAEEESVIKTSSLAEKVILPWVVDILRLC
jgi:hypothetical protein